LEQKTLFIDPNDYQDAILTIHAGAGGVDAMDWAEDLERMYLRWLSKMNFKISIEDRMEGEAGIKRSVIEVCGPYAYGYLRSEVGVHRICHISKFDSNHKKHTSFASVDLTPIYEKVNIEIKDSDLEIEVMRSQGPGGQSVNTTNSAIRVRHKSTGLFVKCQSSKSQIQNKKKAIQLLSSKLQALEDNKQKVSCDKPDISFGHQIRTYISEPYQMVTDHRTGFKSSGINAILDGNLMPLIEAYLRTYSNQYEEKNGT